MLPAAVLPADAFADTTYVLGVVGDFGSAGYGIDGESFAATANPSNPQYVPGATTCGASSTSCNIVANAAWGVSTALTAANPQIILAPGDLIYVPPGRTPAEIADYTAAVGTLYGNYVLNGSGGSLKMLPILGDHDWWHETTSVNLDKTLSDSEAANARYVYAQQVWNDVVYPMYVRDDGARYFEWSQYLFGTPGMHEGSGSNWGSYFSDLYSLTSSQYPSGEGTSSSNNLRWYDSLQGSGTDAVHIFALSNDPNEMYEAHIPSSGTAEAAGLISIDIQDSGASAANLTQTQQGQWFQNAVTSSTAKWKIAMAHQPPITSSVPEEGTDGLPSGGHYSSAYFQIFDDTDVDIVLSGHVHSYERLENNGIVYIVNGAGGTFEDFAYFCNQSGVSSSCDTTFQNAPAFAGTASTTSSNAQMVSLSRFQAYGYYGYQTITINETQSYLRSTFYGSTDPSGATSGGTATWTALDDFFIVKDGTLGAAEATSATGIQLKFSPGATSGGGTIDTEGTLVQTTATISGPGTLTVSGGGTLRLSSASGSVDTPPAADEAGAYSFRPNATALNTHTGGTVVNDGTTLWVSSDGLLGATSGTLTLDNGALFADDGFSSASERTLTLGTGGGTLVSTGAADWLGPTGGTGKLTIQGGTWTLSGTLAHTGGTEVATGELVANTTLPGDVTVDEGAVLGGNATITGDLTNNGTVAPGNSVGHIVVNGDYTQGSSGKLHAEVEEDQRDLLTVHGATALGGTLSIAVSPGIKTKSASFEVLEADTLTGNFDQLIDDNLHITSSWSLSGNQLFLTLDRDFAQTASTSNQRTMAAALNTAFIEDDQGDLDNVFTALDGLTTNSAVGSAFESLSGQSLANMTTAGALMHGQFNRAVETRLDQRRTGTAAIKVEPAQPALTSSGGGGGGGVGSMVRGMAGATAGESEASDAGVSTWAHVIGGFGEVRADGNGVGFDQRLGGLMAGADARLGPDMIGGFTVGYGHIRVKSSDALDEATGESIRIGLYGSADLGPVFVDAQAAYAHTGWDSRRALSFGTLARTASASPDANDVTVSARLGHRFTVGTAVMEPTAGIDWYRLDRAGFTESGAGDAGLVVKSSVVNTVHGTLGARVSTAIETGDGFTVVPEARAAWRHTLAGADVPVSAALIGAPTVGFVVDGATPGRDAALIGFGIAGQTARLRFSLDYELEAAARLTNHAVTAGLKFAL